VKRPAPADAPFDALLRRLGDTHEVQGFLKSAVETKRDAWGLVLQGCPDYDHVTNPWRKAHTLTRWVWYRSSHV
jgi:hypothetical protein